MSKSAGKPTPAGLGAPGRRLWREVSSELTLRPDELAVLDAAARCADRIAQLDAAVKKEGLMTKGSQGQRVLHPAVAEARHQRQLMATLLGRLDIPEDSEAVGGEWDNLTASSRARKAAAARWGRTGYGRA